MNLQEIEHAIANLSSQDLARLRQWFEEFEHNAKSSKSDKHTDKALFEKRLKEARGSLKGSGALKALIEERHKG